MPTHLTLPVQVMGFCDRDFLLSIPDLELAESEGFQP